MPGACTTPAPFDALKLLRPAFCLPMADRPRRIAPGSLPAQGAALPVPLLAPRCSSPRPTTAMPAGVRGPPRRARLQGSRAGPVHATPQPPSACAWQPPGSRDSAHAWPRNRPSNVLPPPQHAPPHRSLGAPVCVRPAPGPCPQGRPHARACPTGLSARPARQGRPCMLFRHFGRPLLARAWSRSRFTHSKHWLAPRARPPPLRRLPAPLASCVQHAQRAAPPSHRCAHVSRPLRGAGHDRGAPLHLRRLMITPLHNHPLAYSWPCTHRTGHPTPSGIAVGLEPGTWKFHMLRKHGQKEGRKGQGPGGAVGRR